MACRQAAAIGTAPDSTWPPPLHGTWFCVIRSPAFLVSSVVQDLAGPPGEPDRVAAAAAEQAGYRAP
jgi:hypothetical protein